jgi:TolB-like protein
MSEDSANQVILGRDVFVSYASQDAAIANAVVEDLERQGIKCWIAPRDVRPGTEYADSIVAAINEAKALVLILSATAVASPHVGREIERAASKLKQVIAFRIDAAPLSRSLEYFLSNSQWIDVQALGMPGALTRLTQAVGQGLAPASWVSPGLGTDASNVVDRKHKYTYLTIRRVFAAAVFLAVVAIVVGVVVRYWPSKHPEAQIPAVAAISDKSIAVLPFSDMSEKKDQEYFADGMAEEILDLLAKIPGLTVIGRTSSFQFKGKNEDLRTIGAKLNAAYVLEGSVRNSGDQVRITAQLINARTGAHEWSETYDRPIGDVLKLQDAIAVAVVRELQLTVAPDYVTSRPIIRNVEAYDLYLRGRHAFERYDNQGLEEAATLFQQALDRDPTFADAAVWYAWAVELRAEFQFVTPAVAFEQARRSAVTALGLDAKNAGAHIVLGEIHIVYDWDWAAAEGEIKQAATLAPGSMDVLYGEEGLSQTFGRWDDALRQVNAALAQDPLDSSSFFRLSQIQANRRHLPEAEVAMRRALDLRPTYSYAHYYLGLLLLARNDHDAALLEMQQEATDEGKQQGRAIAYYALGRKAESDAELDGMTKDQADRNAVGIADVYALRGQSEEAMRWLERAYAQKDSELYFIKSEMELQSLRPDPRFKAFLKKMNLPE